ncbi:MAG: TSUP family transporter [Acidimicrobiia bacterium]|nr:TSUP family transporter [Acidimicrobiia bacterium]
MSVAAIVAVSVVVAAAATVTTLAGFGFSLMAVPLLAVVVGARDAVAVASLLGLLSTAALAVRCRASVDWGIVCRQLGTAVLGMPLGLVVVLVLSDRALRMAIATAVLVATALIARGFRLAGPSTGVDLGAGFVSGVLNTSVGTSGPPVVLANQAHGLAPTTFRGTLSAFFAGSAIVLNPLFYVTGRYTTEVLVAAAVGLPAVGVGWLVGLRLHHRVSPARFRRVVLALLVLSATLAAASALTG